MLDSDPNAHLHSSSVDELAYEALDSAVARCDLVSLTELLDVGLSPNATSPCEPTVLERAMQVNFVPGALLLLQRGAEVTEEDPSLLCQAVARLHSVELSKALIAAGADVNERGLKNATALYYAVEQGDAALCRLLLNAGAAIVPPDTKNLGLNPMCAAAISWRSNAHEIIRILVAAGGSTSELYVGAPSNLELTPFQFAITQGYANNAAMMMAGFGEDPTQTTKAGKTMLELATAAGVKTILETFIRATLAEQATTAGIDAGGGGHRSGTRITREHPTL
jgi:ankyrin repeat protein